MIHNNSLLNLGALLHEKGDLPTAETMFRNALAINRKFLGNEHPSVAKCLSYLGDLLKDKGDFEAAEPLYREAINIYQKVLPKEHWISDYVRSKLGSCFTSLLRYQEAESLLLESYPLLKEKREADDKYTIKTLNFIIELYEAWGKPEKFAEYKALLPDSLKNNY